MLRIILEDLTDPASPEVLNIDGYFGRYVYVTLAWSNISLGSYSYQLPMLSKGHRILCWIVLDAIFLAPFVELDVLFLLLELLGHFFVRCQRWACVLALEPPMQLSLQASNDCPLTLQREIEARLFLIRSLRGLLLRHVNKILKIQNQI